MGSTYSSNRDNYKRVYFPSFMSEFINWGLVFLDFVVHGILRDFVISMCEFDKLYCKVVSWA
jgi:hypothetical protein